jgi:hypothetical protein
MATRPVKIRKESESTREILDYIQEALYKASEEKFEGNVTSPFSKAKQFKKSHPEYHKLPNSILRGWYKYGRAKSDGMMGIRPHYNRLHLWGLGNIYVHENVIPYFSKVNFITINEDDILLHGIMKPQSKARIVLRNYENEDLHELLTSDPIFRYLKVNGVFAEYGHKKACQIHDVIEYFMDNPHMTRSQLEGYGIKGDKLWDLVVNYQPSLDIILRASSKPKGMQYKILSKSQHKSRMDREWSLSEHLSPSDVDAGRLKQQSFDAQTYEAIRSDRWGFFN